MARSATPLSVASWDSRRRLNADPGRSGDIPARWARRRPEPTILTAVKRRATLLAATGILAATSACGSSHRTHLSSNDLRVRSASSGHRYSVREVRRAFAALGLELHRGPRPAPGLVSLVNNARLGPQHIPSPHRVVTVFVATGRQAPASVQFKTGRNTQVTSYANVTVVSKPDVLYQVRSAVSALRWGTASSSAKPGRGLIVLGSSIDGIRLDESRTNVEKALEAAVRADVGSSHISAGTSSSTTGSTTACTSRSSIWRRGGVATTLAPVSTSGQADASCALST